MDGDRLNASGGTKDVWVSDTWGGSTEDHEALQGFELQSIRYNGPDGPEVDSTLKTRWRSGPTATRTRNAVTTNAWMVNTASTRSRTALSSGGFRITKTATTYNSDGLPVAEDNFGTENALGDETCTRTTYARNDDIWMIDRVAQVETLSGACSAASTPAAPASVLKRTRTFYDSYVDESSFGDAPTLGDVVRVNELERFNGATPVYVATSRSTYDSNGRVLTATDARIQVSLRRRRLSR
jgi:hypothetical protein